MNRFMKTILFVLSFSLLCQNAHADIVFPAIAHQFMVSLVVPSYYSIILAILVLFIEAFLIKKFFSKSWVYGFGLSFAINLISSIVGVFIVTFVEGMTRDICVGVFGYHNMRLGTYLGMIPGYGLTVVIEGLLLMCWAKMSFKEKSAPGALMKLSLVMNFYSYTILLAGICLADLITHGQNFKTY